jgi:flagellar hook protein FlgE
MVGAIDQSLSGIRGGFDRLASSAVRIARDGAGSDLAGNVVDMMRARQDVRANAAALRTADQMIGFLLDVMA